MKCNVQLKVHPLSIRHLTDFAKTLGSRGETKTLTVCKGYIAILTTPTCYWQAAAFTHRISVHGGSPLGASISCSSLQATRLPRQEHSTGQRSVLSLSSRLRVDDTLSANEHETSRNAAFHIRSSRRARR